MFTIINGVRAAQRATQAGSPRVASAASTQLAAGGSRSLPRALGIAGALAGVALLGAAVLARLNGDAAAGAGPVAPPARDTTYVPGIGQARDLGNGLYEVVHEDGFVSTTHGGDPPPPTR